MMTRSDRMKRTAGRAMATASAMALTVGAAQAGDLTLRRAILSSGGVGYFEYAARVDPGQSALALRARLDQVDDILKSLIVMDAAGPAALSLPGKAGAAQAFGALPFGEGDLASLPALIGALKGARLSVEGPRKLSGAILSATPETVKDKDGSARTTTRVSLLSGAALEQFTLEEAQGLSFEDKKLGAQVEAALAALAGARDKSGREIAIHLAPGAPREVRLGYVSEAPVWKAAYRLSLGDKGKARLQGWAVVENMTGADWKDVSLTLASGAPVSFRQALYAPYYTQRPTVPPPVPRLALPKIDEGEMPAVLARMQTDGARSARRKAAAPAMAAPRGALADAEEAPENMVAMAAPAPAPLDAPPPPLGASASDAAQAEDGALGASFTITRPVEARAGESLSLPFLDVETKADDVAWAPSDLSERHPWRAARLANDGAAAASWPAGAVTLYEASAAGLRFVGEAQTPVLPSGQERMLAFGADPKMTLDRETTTKGVVSEVAFARGALYVTRLERETTLYRVKNDDSRARDIVIDHRRAQGADLIAPKPDEATLVGQDWRIRRTVEPGKTLALEVTSERPVGQSFFVQEASRAQIAHALFPERGYAQPTREGFAAILSETKLPPEAIERLQKIADAAQAVADAQTRLAALDQEKNDIFADQERLRANLGSVGQQNDFGRSLVAKMQAQEARLSAIEVEAGKTRAAQAAQRKALDDLIGRGTEPMRFKTKQTF